jgi:hypothetical protein
MTTRKRHTAVLGRIAAVAAFMLVCAPAASGASSRNGETISPLPASDYSVRSACGEPASGHAACLALELVPETPAARAHSHPLGMTLAAAAGSHEATEACETPTAAEGCFGMRPIDLHDAYDLPSTAPDAQTIALVDAYNDPTAEADLTAYDEEFGLPACTAGDGCFKQVNEVGAAGDPPFPKTLVELEGHEHGDAGERAEAAEAAGWTVEMSLDIETARAICQSCHIALVEANSATDTSLYTAEQTAFDLGADEISNSWGGPECAEEDGERECLPDSSAFEHPGTVITASAGDFGYQGWDSSEKGFPEFPASSPRVIAVGGTRLLLSEADARTSETVWNDGGESGGVRDGHGAGGGGCSQFPAPLWQTKVSDWHSVGCANRRSVADVSADADPYTGLAVRDSSSRSCESEGVAHWCTIGGTSLSSPLIAAVFALAGGSHGVEYPAHTLYENELASPTSLYDVTEGSNGECRLPFDSATGTSGCTTAEESSASCSSHLTCTAGTGYDGPTGVGTPDGLTAFEPPLGGGEEPGSPGEGVEGGEDGEEEGGTGGGPKGGGTTHAGAGESSAPLLSPGGGSGLLTQDAAGGGGSPGAGTSAHGPVRLSGLALTLKALIALNTNRPRITQLSFTFSSNLPAHVRVALRKLGGRGHEHWLAFGHPFELTVTSGRNTQRLKGSGVLSNGSYRLTLTPAGGAGGAARSIVFRIG